ncbi:MAG: peptide ABC transporter substrate-binding protein [Alphaproteobacteria bacterium]|nr:peptide ABC transporter substrate-binding protein [Alphaproteobacteria bacterium]
MHKRVLAKLSLTLIVLTCYCSFQSLRDSFASETHSTQHLRRSIQSSPDTLDPHVALGIHPLSVLRDLYEGLTNASADNEALPGVATKWDISEDRKKYTFHLRHDAKWSDGTPVTAEHFVFGWKRALDPKTTSPKADLIYIIENAEEIVKGTKKIDDLGIKAIDPYTFEVTLRNPYPYFLNLLTHSIFFPLLPSQIEKYGQNFAKPGIMVSNGAFTLEEWQPQSKILLKKNPHYWDQENVKLTNVSFYPIEDQNALFKLYRANDIDFTYIIPDSQYDFVRKNFPNEFKGGSYLTTAGIGFNLTRPPFKDNLKLREALSLAINREFICERITKTGEIPAYSWVDPSIKEINAPSFSYKNMTQAERLKLAKKLYKEAGYSKEKPLEVELRYDTNDNHKKLVLAISTMWKDLGVKTHLVNEELKVFLQNRQLKQVTEAFRNFWNLDYFDPFSFTQLYLSYSGMNTSGYNCTAYDDLYKKAMASAESQEREESLYNLSKMALESHALLPIFHSVTKRLVKPWVEGYEHNSLDIVYSKNLSIKK